MATYGDLRSGILRLIGNADGEGIEEALMVDAIAAAHDAILPWWPKLQKTTITGDGALSVFSLPADFYQVEAIIVDETSEILSQAVFSPNQYFGLNSLPTNDWSLLPTGQISFAKPLDSGEIYNLYYAAVWTKPTINSKESDVLEPPDYYRYAMTLYAASVLIMPDSLAIASGINPFKTRVDSGNPEHNPLEKAITFLLNLFNQEMNRHPKHQRSQT